MPKYVTLDWDEYQGLKGRILDAISEPLNSNFVFNVLVLPPGTTPEDGLQKYVAHIQQLLEERVARVFGGK
ncbi:hypothetical protein [Alicyclobacillus sp. ALC3]|uniref:hypothetical protein n=1 Tax=Alicyclobacillus sp. ALC3 TaxID=2796143 RepID=UPI002379FEA8|nr:hypothetical protein [Alicyclobacillus sp. ALC3]WDL96935.1 hypothetical protein JC200_22095 [Alicyclobacillus sp. ALC3]